MSVIPSRSVASGVGKPRLIKDMPAVLFTSSASTTFSATTAVDASAISALVLIGMRISATVRVNVAAQDFDFRTYGKVVAIDLVAKTYTVDAWVGGTPTAGIAYTVDGWIADLPRTLKDGLKESYTPLANVLEVYRNRKYVKSYGYDYRASLDYDQRADPDMLYNLRWIMQETLEGSDESITLIPRSDVPGINYEVYLDRPLEFALHESRDYHKGLTIGFRGKAAIAIPPQFLFSGYGVNYGQSYGIGL